MSQRHNLIMPKTPAFNIDSIGHYLSGYADGEGSFCISFSPRPKLLTNLEVRPSFSVSQNGDRQEVLEIFKTFFACGTIRRNPSDRT
ncbi:LAGLIDADG family homing endonuclease, partial [Candidatus Gottesmanbacteria bacterium]|nr:LAGLIDADG family homing endonuclease [Candidatus Gottesmanbacteria bacterium]